MTTKTLYIMRGLPGSGKSTKAATLSPHVFSNDEYFVDSDGIYRFDGSKIKHAVNDCQRRVETAMVSGQTRIVVDNTHTRRFEYQFYLDAAKFYGYAVEIVFPETPWAWNVSECAARNTHSVPLQAIQRMKERFENAPCDSFDRS